jgi:hypothetical protein
VHIASAPFQCLAGVGQARGVHIQRLKAVPAELEARDGERGGEEAVDNSSTPF